jgi:hypothetical protein
VCFENLGGFVEKFETKETGEYRCADFDDVTIGADTMEFIYQNGIKYQQYHELVFIDIFHFKITESILNFV